MSSRKLRALDGPSFGAQVDYLMNGEKEDMRDEDQDAADRFAAEESGDIDYTADSDSDDEDGVEGFLSDSDDDPDGGYERGPKCINGKSSRLYYVARTDRALKRRHAKRMVDFKRVRQEKLQERTAAEEAAAAKALDHAKAVEGVEVEYRSLMDEFGAKMLALESKFNAVAPMSTRLLFTTEKHEHNFDNCETLDPLAVEHQAALKPAVRLFCAMRQPDEWMKQAFYVLETCPNEMASFVTF